MPKRKRRGHGWSSVGRKRIGADKFAIIPKTFILKGSTIPNDGLGFFLTESVKEGERICIYSGKELNKEQAEMSDSKYIVQISKNVFLDARQPEYGFGKFINCGRKSKKTINARLGAGSTYTYHEQLDMKWISVFSTSNINASVYNPVEVFIDYGTEYWSNLSGIICK